MRLRNIVLTGAMAMSAAAARADSLSVGQISAELKSESVIPLAGGVGNDLGRDILYAQTQVDYASLQSLQLSIESVLKAISLYYFPDGPTMITSERAEPLVWLQARIAIDPSLTVTLTPAAVNFGTQTVPEPSVILLLVVGVTWMTLVLRRKP